MCVFKVNLTQEQGNTPTSDGLNEQPDDTHVAQAAGTQMLLGLRD